MRPVAALGRFRPAGPLRQARPAAVLERARHAAVRPPAVMCDGSTQTSPSDWAEPPTSATVVPVASRVDAGTDPIEWPVAVQAPTVAPGGGQVRSVPPPPPPPPPPPEGFVASWSGCPSFSVSAPAGLDLAGRLARAQGQLENKVSLQHQDSPRKAQGDMQTQLLDDLKKWHVQGRKATLRSTGGDALRQRAAATREGEEAALDKPSGELGRWFERRQNVLTRSAMNGEQRSNSAPTVSSAGWAVPKLRQVERAPAEIAQTRKRPSRDPMASHWHEALGLLSQGLAKSERTGRP